MAPFLWATMIALGYAIGSIPFGLLIVRARAGVDLRTVGSGNIGATNVKRVLGFKFFALVMLLDMLKGFLPTLLVRPDVSARMGFGTPGWLPVAVGLATILGHNFSLFLKFRGGKGAATTLGAVAALDPVGTLITAALFVAFLGVTGIMSLAVLLATICFAVFWFLRADPAWGADNVAMSAFVLFAVAMMFWRHRANLARIARGTEPKFWGKPRAPKE